MPLLKQSVEQFAFAREAAFQLSAPSPAFIVPNVIWNGSAWEVLWQVDRADVDIQPAHLVNAVVSPSGDVRRYRLDASVNLKGSVVARSGDQLLFSKASDEFGRCSLMGADLQREVIFAPFFFECAGAAVPEPIGATAEWFVLSADARWPDGLQLARFRPAQAEWSGGPWRLPEVPAAALNWPYIVDDDLWIAPLQGAVHRLEGVASAAAEATSSSIPADSFPEIANQDASVRSVVRTESGPLVIEAALDSFRVFARADDASFEKRLELPHMHEPRGTWDAKFVPELRRVVACMVSNSGVSLIEIDERGELAKDVVTLDSSPAAIACDLAWSGSELLVAWSYRSDPDLMSPGIYELRAKIVGLDE